MRPFFVKSDCTCLSSSMDLQFWKDPVGEGSLDVVLGSFWLVGVMKVGVAETRGDSGRRVTAIVFIMVLGAN